MSNGTTARPESEARHPKTRADWRCPAWCVNEPSDHERDSEAIDNGDGGAIHRSRQWRVSSPRDLPDAVVHIAQATSATGPDDSVEICLDGSDYDVDEARKIALALLSAVALAENEPSLRLV